ncbi:MAG TPA: alginate lyase family protein, partial [Anaerolineales bacterium]
MNLTSTKPAILWSLMLCLGLLVLPFSRASAQLGIWTSAQELATLPMAGEAWQDVFEAGSKSIARPRLSNQNDRTNVLALAAAIVYARTGEVDYKERVSETCEKLAAGGNPGGRTLAWARGLGAYALAADLVGYRTPEFEQWLRAMADEFLANDKRTLRGMFQERPNNWGAHAFGSLCAVYRYLGDFEALRQVRDYWVQSLTGPNPGLDYGEDSTWHAVPTDPRWINPKGMYRDTLNIGGIVPDDMRRGGSFQTPPTYTSYAWEGLQGLLMAARILERANMPVWAEGDSALYRAASALQERFAAKFGERWQASGDDSWQLPFYDQAYGTNWVRDQRGLWKNGKSSGWGYVTLAGEQPPKFRVNVTTID